MGTKNKNKKNKTKPEAGATSEAAHDSNNRRSYGKSSSGKMITDPRFSSLHWDPRFREAPKHKAKVAIDSRFSRMFTDKNFASSKVQIDKRGRFRNKDSAVNSLKHYYRLEEEEEKRGEKVLMSEDSEESESEKLQTGDDESDSEIEESENDIEESDDKSEESESESEDEEKNEHNLKLKSKSDSEDEEEEGSDELWLDSDSEDEEEPEMVPEIEKETNRLAVVNMDWSQVKAVDLYVALSSFLPKGGQIKSVAVYPSEFGLKRMEEEAVHGPVGLFDDDKEKNDKDEDDDDDDDEIDNRKLRAYEKSRLRYYYAVVECDSIATADYLYKNCDGVEFERSSTELDLRFIPDSMEFKHPPRDAATEAPAEYEGLDFHTKALQHSNIHLTWDDDEPHRTKTLKRKFNADQLADLELEEFLASDESESNDSDNDEGMKNRSSEKQKKWDLYRSLVQSGDGLDENDEEENQDMEVTFNTGLEDLSKRILEKKDAKSESIWEAYLRKRREKKKARKNRSNNSSEDESSSADEEPSEQPDDFFLEEFSGKGCKTDGRNARKEKQNDEMVQEAEASRAELELLLADDKGTESNLKGYNLKRKKMKGKKGKEISDEGKLPTIDYDDPRFSSLFTSPLFALDPTDPQFKRSAAYARQMTQKQQKDEKETMGEKEQSELPTQGVMLEDKAETDHNGDLPKKHKYELSSLVRSIKMKSKQVRHPAKVPEKINERKLNAKGSK